MNKRVYGYARGIAQTEELEAQILALKEMGVEEKNIIVDELKHKAAPMTWYRALKHNMLRQGDVLVIKELSNLGNGMMQIKDEWQALHSLDIEIEVIDTPVLSTTNQSETNKLLIGQVVYEALNYMSNKEREVAKRKQAEGIAAAKAQGKHLGRPKVTFPNEWEEVYKSWKLRKITARVAMETLGLKRTTFYKLVKNYEKENVL